MTLSLKVEVMAGSNIESASKELKALADRIGVLVEAQFNEVLLMMPPDGDADALTRSFYRALKSESKFKIADGYRTNAVKQTGGV